MMPIFKRKKAWNSWVAFQAWRPQSFWTGLHYPNTSDTKYSTLAVYALPCDYSNSVTFQSLLNCGCNFAPLWRYRKSSRLVIGKVAADEACPNSVHPQQGFASIQIHKSASQDKVSKLLFWLCNYLFSYNCRFSCIIRPTNIKLFLMVLHILNDAVRSQKGSKWYPEKSAEKNTALSGQGQDTQKLWAYSANLESLWYLSQYGTVHCNSTKAAVNFNSSCRTHPCIESATQRAEGHL